MVTGTNPLTCMDYPDADVIRVDDTYYMVSTTMYFMPGAAILRSYDLLNWEVLTYVYEELDNTLGQCLEGNEHAYAQGMWAASLRYHKGKFYVAFIANDTHKTYLYQADSIMGPWKKQNIEGFYHDLSLLFDDDGRVYIAYGGTQIWLTELNEDLTAPKQDGLHRLLVEDTGDVRLGYEGTHLQKINGKYYLFMIHWPNTEPGRRTEAVFVSDSLEGEFVGKDVMNDDMGYRNAGAAQGGIVDTPDGDWYAILFRDMGAVGRIPVIMPVTFVDDFPVFGIDGKIPQTLTIKSTKPEHVYQPLYISDDFCYEADADGKTKLNPVWQWNHTPVNTLWSVTDKPGTLRIKTDKLAKNPIFARNTLTQRTLWPYCEAEVTVDGTELNNGDFAGLCILQSRYGMAAVTKEQDKYYLVMRVRDDEDISFRGLPEDYGPGKEYFRMELEGSMARVKAVCNFEETLDTVKFYYQKDNEWVPIGPVHHLYFKLDHFTGARFGLFVYSEKEIGGIGSFSDFVYVDKK